MPLVTVGMAFFAAAVLLLLHHGWKHAHEDPATSLAQHESCPEVCYFKGGPALGRRQLQDLQPRDVDHTLCLARRGLLAVVDSVSDTDSRCFFINTDRSGVYVYEFRSSRHLLLCPDHQSSF
jgi:hypothetical protein